MISSLLKTSNNTTLYRPEMETWASGYGGSKCKRDPPKGISSGIKSFVDVGDIIHKKRNVIDSKINENILKYNKGIDYMKYEQTLNNKTLMSTSDNASVESKGSIENNIFKDLMTVDSNYDIHLLNPKKRQGKIVVNAQSNKNEYSSTDKNIRNTKIQLKNKPAIKRNAVKTQQKDTIRHKNVLFSLSQGVNTNMDSKHTTCIDLNDNYKTIDTGNFIINKMRSKVESNKTLNIDLNNYRNKNTDYHINNRVNTQLDSKESYSVDKTDYTHNNIELSERPDVSSEATHIYKDDSKTTYANVEKFSVKQTNQPVYENFETSKLPQHYNYKNNNAEHYTSGNLNNLDLSSFSMTADSVRHKN